MKLQSADVPQQSLKVYVSFAKVSFFVVSLLEASPVHETLWEQREVVQKFERVTFLVYGTPTNDKRTFHFQCFLTKIR